MLVGDVKTMLIESTSLNSIPLLFKALKAMTEFGYILIDEKHIEFITLSTLHVSCVRASFAREYFSTFNIDKPIVITTNNKVLGTTVKDGYDSPGNSWTITDNNNSTFKLIIHTAKKVVTINLNEDIPRYQIQQIEEFKTNFEHLYTAAIKMDANVFAVEMDSYDDTIIFDLVMSDDRTFITFTPSTKIYNGNIVTIKTKPNTTDALIWGSYDMSETRNIVEFVKRSKFFSFFMGNYIPIKYVMVIGNKYVPSSFNDKKTNDFSITYYIAPRASNNEVDDALDDDQFDEPTTVVMSECDESTNDDDESRSYMLNDSE